MQTSIVGYPRIGAQRELKFATERYFSGACSAAALQETAGEIRMRQWEQQRRAGIDFIPSNDFSLYDNVLDTAVLFQIIPRRYAELDLSPLERYFAMARGYQGAAGDVRALAMRKWFNTNYHYLVPELDDDTEIRLAGEKPFAEFAEAKTAGILTKPVITGAFTLLRLLRCTGTRTAEDCADAFIQVYREFLGRFAELGAAWLELDEPCLVQDLSDADLALFLRLYRGILPAKGGTKILLQTYFGDVRDCYRQIMELDFDGVGLDFVEGKQTLPLVRENGFPAGKKLFAGVINGKNIWRNSYASTLSLLEELESRGIDVVLSTSCSLLHVPYTLRGESRLPEHCTRHFAFAEEKLTELAELKALSEQGLGEKAYTADVRFTENQTRFGERPGSTDPDVQQRIASIRAEDFVRKPAFAERAEIQKKLFDLPLLPTTTIGSFPQTADVKHNRNAYRTGQIDREAYVAFNRRKIAQCVALQEEIGLDVLVHGEYERNDMVEYFGEQLNGFLFTEKAWVQSYGTRCVKPPIIWGDVSRNGAMTVEWSRYAQSLTERPLKGMLTGPVTILNWSFPREDIPLKESAYQIALAIRDEALDLEANGIRIIQVDEAALREKLPLRRSDWYKAYLDWAIPAFRLVHSGLKAQTQLHTHMCYSEFRDILRAIDDMDADVITFEASRSDLQILDALQENHFQTALGPGVYDIHSPRVPAVEEIKAALRKMLEKIDPQKLWVNPDCGLKTRDVPETVASLKNLVRAAKEVRDEISGAVSEKDGVIL